MLHDSQEKMERHHAGEDVFDEDEVRAISWDLSLYPHMYNTLNSRTSPSLSCLFLSKTYDMLKHRMELIEQKLKKMDVLDEAVSQNSGKFNIT
jgi:hypothetical protein